MTLLLQSASEGECQESVFKHSTKVSSSCVSVFSFVVDRATLNDYKGVIQIPVQFQTLHYAPAACDRCSRLCHSAFNVLLCDLGHDVTYWGEIATTKSDGIIVFPHDVAPAAHVGSPLTFQHAARMRKTLPNERSSPGTRTHLVFLYMCLLECSRMTLVRLVTTAMSKQGT
jgi:hypothetical protein